MKTNLFAVFCVSSMMLFCGCPPTGVVCKTGTTACGIGCADVKSDRRNCGACGNACGNTQECNNGVCACPTESTVCDGSCAVVSADRKNCGACGVSCTGSQVCESGACKGFCTGENTACNGACVDTLSAQNNCGACGTTCEMGQQCWLGKCEFAHVAACQTSGHVVGFTATSLGVLSDLGNFPASLARIDNTLLSADGLDKRMYQASFAGNTLVESRFSNKVGDAANQVLVSGQFVYVVNAGSGTLQTLQRNADGGDVNLDGGINEGVRLATVSEINFGMNSFPEGVAKLGNELFVPLYGGTSSSTADAGGRVVVLSLANPASPMQTAQKIELGGLDLKPFDGGMTVPRPFAIAAHNGAIYVALNNLNPDSYAVEGPGLLAKYNPLDAGLSVIDLDGSKCLNPVWLKSAGTNLVVSCAGKADYNSVYAVSNLQNGGLLLLDSNDVIRSQWKAGCTDAGVELDGGAKCTWFFPGRFGVQGTRVILGDQNAGRVVMFDVADGGFTAVRGLNNAISACPVNTNGIANVSDILTP